MYKYINRSKTNTSILMWHRYVRNTIIGSGNCVDVRLKPKDVDRDKN